jgi:hypothetical protein
MMGGHMGGIMGGGLWGWLIPILALLAIAALVKYLIGK